MLMNSFANHMIPTATDSRGTGVRKRWSCSAKRCTGIEKARTASSASQALSIKPTMVVDSSGGAKCRSC